MAKEIERKFLVKNDLFKLNVQGKFYSQAYLNSNENRTVRIRIVEDKAYLTIKGIANSFSRDEFEYAIPLEDAQEMMRNICEKPIIEKIRYRVTYANKLWEIDEFFGENKGLTVAEIELKSESESFEEPEWLGIEVTGKKEYYNSSLVENPYTKWKIVP